MDMRIVYVDVCCAHGDCVFVVIVVIVVIEARSNSNWSISDSTRDTYDVQPMEDRPHTRSRTATGDAYALHESAPPDRWCVTWKNLEYLRKEVGKDGERLMTKKRFWRFLESERLVASCCCLLCVDDI